MPEFEYDPAKSASNKAKHGIDFEEAQRLWDGLTATFATKPGTDEERHMTFGVIDGRHWTAITTPRGVRVRIISVRRSRESDERAYEEACKRFGD